MASAPPALLDVERDAPDEEWQCFICMGTTEGRADKERLTLACGHSVHLACWLPCVLSTMGEDSAQARFVEDRLGRKCGLCRGEFSDELSSALKDRRLIIRKSRRGQERASDPAFQRLLSLLSAHGLASSGALASLPGAGERATDPRTELLDLDMGDVHTALSRAAGIDLHKLSLAMRAQLQLAGHSPSGLDETLAGRIIEKGLATKGFFFTLMQKDLLTKTEPLRTIILKQIEPLKELKAPPPSRPPVAAPTPRPPPTLPPRPAPFCPEDILAALGPVGDPSLPSLPSLPTFSEGVAQLASMGFPQAQALQALRACDGNVESAIAICLNMG